MAKFPYGGFGGEGDADVPWVKLSTIREYLEDGEPLPPNLGRWLGEAIKAANCDPMALLIGLGLRKPQGRPSAWGDPKAEQALRWLYELTSAGCISDKDAPKELQCPSERKSLPPISDEAAIERVRTEFMTTDGDDRFSRQTLQRWLAAVRLVEHEARDSPEEENA